MTPDVRCLVVALSETLEQDLVAMIVDPVAFQDVLVVHKPRMSNKCLFFRSYKSCLVMMVVVVVVVMVVVMVAIGVVERGVF